MADFSTEHKEESAQFFTEGVHEVTIGEVKSDETDAGKEFIEFTVLGENNEEGTARLWFSSDKAIKYSFNIIRGIFVHNTPEAKRDDIRAKVNAVRNTDELVTLCQGLIGKKCFYQVEKSDRTYTNAAGEVKNSYDRNVYGYEPKPRKSPVDEDGNVNLSEVGNDEVPFDL